MVAEAHSSRRSIGQHSHSPHFMKTNSLVVDGLGKERDTVKQMLTDSIAQLYMPFDHLARAQIEKAEPYDCAMAVLATGIGENEDGSPDTEKGLRGQRIYLGAALEMLRIALTIHQFLLQQEAISPRRTMISKDEQEDDAQQRSITGSVILTGDYCFTQSAILAAKTDNVKVVEIFSQTLKAVSEAILRQGFIGSSSNQQSHQSDNSQAAPSENNPPSTLPLPQNQTKLMLCKAGIEGAAALLSLPPTQLASVKALVEIWLSHEQNEFLSPATLTDLAQLPTAIQQRWLALLRADVVTNAD